MCILQLRILKVIASIAFTYKVSYILWHSIIAFLNIIHLWVNKILVVVVVVGHRKVVIALKTIKVIKKDTYL